MMNLTFLIVIIGSTLMLTTATAWPSSLQNDDQDQCSLGPAHWCANIINAKQCNAMEYCIKAIWKPKIVPDDVDVDMDHICSTCQSMVNNAGVILQDKKTQSDILAMFIESCGLIKVKPIENECIGRVKAYIPIYLRVLAANLNSKLVCGIMGMCKYHSFNEIIV